MRRACLCLLLFVISAAADLGAQSPAQPKPSAITLKELEQLALENNPTARAAQAAIEAARGRVRQAGAWPNPTIGYSAEEITTRGDVDPRGAHGFFVEQTIPLGGKLRLSRDVFARALDEAEARTDLQRQRILSSVRSLFYQVLTAERRVEVHQRLTVLGNEATMVTAQLFNVGAADRPDYLESDIERRRVQLELNAARNQVFALRQQLAAVAGRPEMATRLLAGSIDEAIPELERDATFQALIERSAQMRAARAAVVRAQALTARARRETSPDLFLRGGAVYNREHGEDTGRPIGWEGQFEAGVTVPLFNRNQGGIATARAEETLAQAEVARLELSLRANAAAEFAEYLTALRSAESFRGEILPRAERSYTLYLSRYREMAAAYPQVVVAQRTLFDMAREYLVHLETAWRSALRLQGLMAGDGLEPPDSMFDAAADTMRRERE
jgi:outer membrane protein, heavy metal efflux system